MSPISLYDALSTLKDSMDIAKTRVQLDGYISGVSVYKGKGNSGNEYCTFCITDVTGPSIHVFVPNYAYKNYSKDIFNGNYIELTGTLSLFISKNNSPYIQIWCNEIKATFSESHYIFFENTNPKPLPTSLKSLALISSDKSAGGKDFESILSSELKDICHKYITPVEGPNAISDIVKVIDIINAQNNADLICITRGGGNEIKMRAVFDSPELHQAILFSKIPVLVAVGHSENIFQADRASDAPYVNNEKRKFFKTPTDLAYFLNNSYVNKEQNHKSFKAMPQKTNNYTFLLCCIIFFLVVFILILLFDK